MLLAGPFSLTVFDGLGALLSPELLDEGVVSEDEFASGLSWAVSEEYVDSSQVRLTRRRRRRRVLLSSSRLGSLSRLSELPT